MNKSKKKFKIYFYKLIRSFLLPIISVLLFLSITRNLYITLPLLSGIVFLIIGNLKPKVLLLIYGNLLIFLEGIKSFLIFIFIVITYFLFVQPFALIIKLFGYDPLDKKITSSESYRKNTQNKNIDLTKIF